LPYRPSIQIIQWLKKLGQFFSIQIVIQGLNFASGVLIIRVLSKQEYAYFTLANALQGCMTLLADSGITPALLSMGGKVWQDEERLGQLVNAARQLRRFMAGIALVIVIPIFLWMSIGQNASITAAILLAIGISIELIFYLNIGVLGIVLRLRSKLNRIQGLDFINSSVRLLLLSCFSLLHLNSIICIFISTFASWVKNIFLYRWVKNKVNLQALPTAKQKDEMFGIVKPQIPNTIYFCIQGQVTIGLIGILGNTQGIADIGALSRLGMVLAIFDYAIGTIAVPSFSRCQSVQTLQYRYWQILGLQVLLSGIILGGALLFSGQIVSILGSQYTSLKSNLAWMAVSLLFDRLIRVMWALNSSKSWVRKSWLYIPSTLVVQVMLLFWLDLSTVRGVILFGIYSLIPWFLINCYLSYRGIRSYKMIA
jgi:O-antigen/teichoic acid export membrane protein